MQQNRWFTIYLVFVLFIGAGILIWLGTTHPFPSVGPFLLLAFLAILGAWIAIPLPHGGYQTVSMPVIFAALALHGTFTAVLVASIGVVVGNGILRRRPVRRVLYNAAHFVIVPTIAGTAFHLVSLSGHSLTGPWVTEPLTARTILGALVAILLYEGIGTPLISLAITFDRREEFRHILFQNLPWVPLNGFLLGAVGTTIALVYAGRLPPDAVFVVFSLVFMALVFLLYTSRENAQRDLTRLFQAAQEMGRHLTTEEILQVVERALRQLVDTDAFFLVLIDWPSGRRRYVLGRGVSLERLAAVHPEIDRGLTGLAIRFGKPVHTGDYQEDPRRTQQEALILGEGKARSVLAVPLTTGNEVIGAVVLVKRIAHYFSEYHLRVIATLAHQAALAIKNAQLYESKARQLRRMQALEEISARINSALDVEEVFRFIAEHIRDVLGTDKCALYLGVPEEGIKRALSHGLSEGYIQAVQGFIREGLGWKVWTTRMPVVIRDAQIDQPSIVLREAARQEGIHTIMVIPLLHGGKVIGALTLYHTQVQEYSDEDLRLAQTFANHVAIAIRNATLVADVRRRAHEMEAINRILTAISAILNPQELPRYIVEEIAKVLGYQSIALYLVDGHQAKVAAEAGEQREHCSFVQKKGLAQVAATTQEPQLWRKEGWVEVYVPVSIGVQMFAVLGIGHTALDERDQELLVTLTRQIGVVLRNAQLYEEVRLSRDELEALHEATKVIGTSLALREVLNTIVSTVCRAFHYDLGAILLVDELAGELVLEASYGYGKEVVGYRQAIGRGIVGWVAHTGQPYISGDVLRDPYYVTLEEGTRSEIAVPLILEGKVIGVFNIESRRPRAFGERDLRILTSLASYATIAIENARLYEETKRLAITDGLTGLYNHRFLHEAFERELEQARRYRLPLSLILVEVDRFKTFNDTYGHLCGDEILKTVANLLRRNSRSADIVARYGGDEFVLLLPHTTKRDAHEIAERIRRSIAHYPIPIRERFVTATVSVGVAAFPEDGRTAETLVEAADKAMYIAKHMGGNRVAVAQKEMGPV
ncbi:MAG: GAF domain-containing protein [Armatimonadota bacterium]|nr:GAF domain-containing protein [Armatimonadota bacterium]